MVSATSRPAALGSHLPTEPLLTPSFQIPGLNFLNSIQLQLRLRRTWHRQTLSQHNLFMYSLFTDDRANYNNSSRVTDYIGWKSFSQQLRNLSQRKTARILCSHRIQLWVEDLNQFYEDSQRADDIEYGNTQDPNNHCFTTVELRGPTQDLEWVESCRTQRLKCRNIGFSHC